MARLRDLQYRLRRHRRVQVDGRSSEITRPPLGSRSFYLDFVVKMFGFKLDLQLVVVYSSGSLPYMRYKPKDTYSIIQSSTLSASQSSPV